MLVVGRQHALIKKCALNNEVHLITQVYGRLFQLDIMIIQSVAYTTARWGKGVYLDSYQALKYEYGSNITRATFEGRISPA